MASLTSYQEFADHCLRKLGAPVIQINLDPVNIQDAILEALEKFWEEHMDGSRVYYYIKDITADEAANNAFTVPNELGIDRIVRVIPVGNGFGVGEWHTVPWQTAYASVAGVTGYVSVRASDFTLLRQRLKTLRSQFNTPLTFKYSKHSKQVDLQFKVNEGDRIAFECFQNVDPNKPEFVDAWNNDWLQRYAAALIKERWGNVLVNLQGVKLPGGLEINGDRIYETSRAEIEQLLIELRTKFQSPLGFMVG